MTPTFYTRCQTAFENREACRNISRNAHQLSWALYCNPISLSAASCFISPPVSCTICRPCISACGTTFSYQLSAQLHQSYTRHDGLQSRSHILAAWPRLLLNAIDSLSAVETSHDRHTTCTSRVWPAWHVHLDLCALFDFIFPSAIQ